MKSQIENPQPGYRYFHIVAMVFVSSLLIANTLAVKIISFWEFTLPSAIIVFPISYIFGDILTEVYGYRRTRSVIWTGFFCLAGMSLLFWIATQLPAASFWQDQEPFSRLFGFVPRLAISSFIAYLVGEYLNSVVLSRMKVKDGGKRFYRRAIISTMVGEGADSLIFYTLAFGGILPLSVLVKVGLSAYILKCLYEVIAIKFTSIIVDRLKKAEGVDVFDVNESYNIY